ncbi:MAG TPA: DUF2306 domain-containing protein [Pirellulales bacterium]|nr:DUF2306 domain-containing protein [Pirellulales bacterium]
MPNVRSTKLQRALTLLAGLLILKVTAAVVLGYRNYFPPDFNADFLRGREGYFFAGYQWPFYAHIASGPVSLVLGTLLVSERFRMRFAKWHRRLGRLQVASILLLVAPSGLWMAYYAQAGAAAAASFALLAILTASCAALGWRAAVGRRFAVHRRWMRRCFVLLCSAVLLRLIGGLATVAGVYALWFDPLAAWVCWILPLAVFELSASRKNRRGARWSAQPSPTAAVQ